jgi:hypothetical protein
MKHSTTKNTAVKPAGTAANNKETVASGVRVRTALKAGLNFTKIEYK